MAVTVVEVEKVIACKDCGVLLKFSTRDEWVDHESTPVRVYVKCPRCQVNIRVNNIP